MATLKQLELQIKELKDRNKLVEANKGWETSWTRRLLIALFTYLALGLYLWAIRIPYPWLNAIVPTVGFLLSTLTLPFFRAWWLRKRG